MSKPTYRTSISTLAASGLRSSVQISTEAGARDSRLDSSQDRVRPGVDDVLDDQHVPAGDVGVEVLEDAHDAGGLGARAVGRHRHPVHRGGAGQRPGQVGHHHDRALEDADQQQVLAVVVGLDLGGQLVEPGVDLLLGDQDLLEVGSHVGSVHGSTPGRSAGSARGVGCGAIQPEAAAAMDTRPPRAGSPASGAGQADRPLAVPVVTSASQRLGMPRLSCPAGAPAATASRRQTRVRTARGSASSASTQPVDAPDPAVDRAPASRALVGQRVEGVGVLAQQVGGAGQRGATPGPEVALEVARARGGRGPGRRPGPRCAGRPTVEALGRAGRAGLRPGSGRAGAPVAAAARGIPARERAPSRGRGRAAPSRPGRRGCGRAGRGGAEPVGGRVERGVAGRPGGGLGPPAPAATSTVATSTGSRPERPRSWSAAVPATSAEPACSPWSTTTAPARRPSRGASNATAAARASESAPPLQRDQHDGRPGGTRPAPSRTATRMAAAAGCGPVTSAAPGASRVSRGPGRPRPRGRRSRRAAAGSRATPRRG